MFSYHISAQLQLRLIEIRHAEEIYPVIDRNRQHIRAWMGWVDKNNSVEDTRKWCESAAKQFAASDGFQAGLWADNQYVGSIGYHSIDWNNRKTTIGYWLDRQSLGRGWMTAACRAMVNHALVTLDLNRVEIRCGTQNHKSRAIPMRLGFTHEGTLRQNEWIVDRFVDHEVYGMLKEHWPATSD